MERLPAVDGSPFGADTDYGMMHQDLIALLGLPIGELWQLDKLSCAAPAAGATRSSCARADGAGDVRGLWRRARFLVATGHLVTAKFRRMID